MAARTKVHVDIITKADGQEPGAGLKKFAIGAGVAAVAIAGLIKVGKELEGLYAVQEQAEKRLEQTIRATSKAAGLNARELQNMASELQSVTKFGDEATLGAQSLLLTFKNIGGDVFPRALESILDVSEAMGTGLKESSIQLGKALNDPVGGIAALTRVGIQFTDAQKETIKQMVEMNDTAGAQGIILDELESQFGGVARAAAQTGSGIKTQLDNNFGDLGETLGGVITHGLIPFRQELLKEVDAVNKTIKAHFIRSKAIRGEATVIELLTLREIEQEKAEKRLTDAKDNLVRAEENLIEIGEASDSVSNLRRDSLKRGIEVAKENIKVLEGEVNAKTRATEATERLFAAEQNSIDAKLAQFQIVEETNEKQEETVKLIDEQDEAILKLHEDTSVMFGASEAGFEKQEEQIKNLNLEYVALANDGLGAFASAFEEVGAGNITLWEGVKQGGKDAVSALLKSYAQLWIAQAAAAAVLLQFATAAGLLAAAAGAFAASGFVQSFATGGSFITDGPTSVGGNLAGDNPSGQERVTVEPLGGGGGSSNNSGQVMILRIGDRDVKAVVQGWIDNRGLRSSRGGAI